MTTTHMRLRVSDDRRGLVHGDGSPFFLLGDTAWELLHRLDRVETGTYLADRAAKGFTVVLTTALAEFEFDRPNAPGALPLTDNDPARPNEDYFAHVDWVVARANAQGLWVGLLPTWGDKWNRGVGPFPEVFTPENAHAYGAWLGRRYRDAGLIWVLGGDRPVETHRDRAIIRAMVAGLKEGDGGGHLMTFHPPGGHASSDYFPDDTWLDFSLSQTGHVGLVPSYRHIARDYANPPVRPVLDGEPCYEDHPIMTPEWTRAEGWFGAHAVRRAAYWALLSGACGHVYGCHDVWQMWDPRREPVNGARTPWRDALNLPGAGQMRHTRALREAYPAARVPDQSLLASDPGEGAGHVAACRSEDGRSALLYVPDGRPVALALDRLAGPTLRASWYDPRTGAVAEASTVAANGIKEFTPPRPDTDWVLILGARERG